MRVRDQRLWLCLFSFIPVHGRLPCIFLPQWSVTVTLLPCIFITSPKCFCSKAFTPQPAGLRPFVEQVTVQTLHQQVKCVPFQLNMFMEQADICSAASKSETCCIHIKMFCSRCNAVQPSIVQERPLYCKLVSRLFHFANHQQLQAGLKPHFVYLEFLHCAFWCTVLHGETDICRAACKLFVSSSAHFGRIDTGVQRHL